MNDNAQQHARRFFPLQITLVCFTFTLMLVGCGPSISPVTGTVTYKGEPVKGGTLIFSPVGEGTAATGTVQDDGTYVLKTDTSNGAQVGKVKVTYSAPGGEASTDPKKQGIASPYVGLVPKTPEIEVKSGANTIDIELEIDKNPKVRKK
jgi:hypothetical protein